MAALSFVKQLELAPMAENEVQLALRAKSSAVKEQKEQGFIDTGRLVSFTKKISRVHKSCRCAKQYTLGSARCWQNRKKDTDKWYEIYINVLVKVGWVVQFERYTKQVIRPWEFPKQLSTLLKLFYPHLRLRLSNVCWNPSNLKEMSHGGLCLTASPWVTARMETSKWYPAAKIFLVRWWWHWVLLPYSFSQRGSLDMVWLQLH